MSDQPSDRRSFLKLAAGFAASLGLAPELIGRAAAATSTTTRREATSAGTSASAPLPRRPMGRTGETISILAIGGASIGGMHDEQDAISLMHEAIDAGVNFCDNAWCYQDGRAEERMGKALAGGYRDKVVLMTKHHGRDKATSMKHLEESLRRLQTDHIDVWQFHEVIYDDDPDMIFAPGGSVEAAEQARQEGKVRFIGFTGHKDPAIFKKMLAHDYAWDTVQMPVNPFDPHYKSFELEILPILKERGIGVLGMKSCGGGGLLRTGKVTPQECLRYAWTRGVDTIISGMDSMPVMRENVEFARGFTPMSETELAALLERTREFANTGENEWYKTTQRFDGPFGRELHGIG